MSSRDTILAKLRSRQRPFPQVQPPAVYRPMTPLAGEAAEWRARFIQEATALNITIHQPAVYSEAIELVLDILAGDKAVLAWADGAMPLPGLAEALAAAGVTIAPPGDDKVRVGISGATAALAATGSLVLASGSGRHRATSLLPPVHIVVLTADQILPHLEAWMSQQRAAGLTLFEESGNIAIISGPSRTADIGMELILGMHGPREMHLLLLG
jgi:L-lactate dehydrogenase complex protein LldG